MRQTRVILAAAHLDHNPGNNRLGNLRSFCQRCHLIHDRPHHLARRRITYLLRRALGDCSSALTPPDKTRRDRWAALPDNRGIYWIITR